MSAGLRLSMVRRRMPDEPGRDHEPIRLGETIPRSTGPDRTPGEDVLDHLLTFH
jgi:hypothetical protein